MEPTLLIAEDNPELTVLYQHYLTRCGYQVFAASGGVECLSIIRNESLLVVVMSVDLPWSGADGLVDFLHEESCHRSVPSVILTGGTAHENVAELCEVPCVFRYLRKPFLWMKLLECIRSIESDWMENLGSVRLRPRHIAASCN